MASLKKTSKNMPAKPAARARVSSKAKLAPSASKAPATPTARDEAEAVSLDVRKAYKMLVGGAFIRSESGRYFQVKSALTGARENLPMGSRKDIRDAVKAARAAQGGWASRTAFNRGQILYRLGEMLDARRDELTEALCHGGLSIRDAAKEHAATVERTLAFAGWADKYFGILSSYNPVASPHFNFSVPEPTGVVGIAAPGRPALLGLMGAVLPAIVSGNTVVVIAGEEDPRTALILGEAIATSDMPGGVINILTGKAAEMLPHLGKHMDVNAVSLHGVDDKLTKAVKEDAAASVKRVSASALSDRDWFNPSLTESPAWIERFTELKTVWHPAGR